MLHLLILFYSSEPGKTPYSIAPRAALFFQNLQHILAVNFYEIYS